MRGENIVRAVLEEFGGRLVLAPIAVGRPLFSCNRKVGLGELRLLLREYGIEDVVGEGSRVEVEDEEVKKE